MFARWMAEFSLATMMLSKTRRSRMLLEVLARTLREELP